MRYVSVLLILFIGLSSCTEQARKARPLSTGKLGEIFVVLDDEFNTEGTRVAIKQVLAQAQPLFGAPEPYFKVLFISPGMARGSMLYEGTMLLVSTPKKDSDILPLLPKKLDSLILAQRKKKVVSFVHKDLWSAPQRLLFVVAQNNEEFVNLLKNSGGQLLNRMLKLEMEEAQHRMTYLPDEKISKEVKELHGIRVKAPTSFHIVSNAKLTDEEGIVWMREDGDLTDLNLVIHYQPYTDTAQFQLDSLIARRDTLLRPLITGEAANSYMATDTQFKFHLQTIDFNGHFAKAYSGYWTMQNDFMGGPYYSITALDEKNQRLITMEGFVYAPKYDKTEYIRTLQGIIQGITF